MMHLFSLCALTLGITGCSSTKGQPIEPHRHVALADPNPATEGRIPSGEKSVPLSKPISKVDCEDYEKMAKIACLFPSQRVPFPICQVDDAYAVLGVLPYAACTEDAAIVDHHMDYAKKTYAPSTIGLMLRMRSKLKGELKTSFTRPLLYIEKLTGKDAHIMMGSIWNEWQINGTFTPAMKTVVEEQARREPDCIFYQYLHDAAQGTYEGSTMLALDARSNCDYYNDYDQDERTIDILFVQYLLVKEMN